MEEFIMKLNLTEVEKKMKLNPEDNYSILENLGLQKTKVDTLQN